MGSHGAISGHRGAPRASVVTGLLVAVVEAVQGHDLGAAVAAAKALVVFLERHGGGGADEQPEAGNDNGTMVGLTLISPVGHLVALDLCA